MVVACEDRAHFVVAMLAAWSRECHLALAHNARPDTIHALADSLGAPLLHDQDVGRGIDLRALSPGQPRPRTLGVDTQRLAAVAFTSGSTGQPTPHEKSFGQLLGEVACHLDNFDLRGANLVASAPAHHIYGLLFGVLVPLCGGGTTTRTSPTWSGQVLSELKATTAPVWVAVPAHLRAMGACAVEDWPQVRTVFSSGAPLDAALAAQLRSAGISIVELLGSTETGGIASRSRDGAHWHSLPSVECRVEDDGRLVVRSPWLSRESGGELPTGDRARALGDGGFEHLGRADEVVKLGGRRIALGEVEARLRELEGVRDARVIAREVKGVRGQELLAVVEAEGWTPAELRRTLCQRLDAATVPRRYRIVEALPRTAMGKVSRQALEALFDARGGTVELAPSAEGRSTERLSGPAPSATLRAK